MAAENIPILPLVADPQGERRTVAFERQAAAQTATATQAERAAAAMEAAAGLAGYAQRRAEVLALVGVALGQRLVADTHGAVAMALATVERVDEMLPEPTEPPPPANG